MTEINFLSDDNFGSFTMMIEKGKRNEIDPKKLAVALRSNNPIPSEIRLFLADYLDGKIKHKRGAKNKSQKTLRDITMFYQVRSYVEEGLSENKAIEDIAKEFGMSVSLARNTYYRNKRILNI